MEAVNLVAREHNGTSDSFVEIKLSINKATSFRKSYKNRNKKAETSVREKTLNPVWNEILEL